MKLSNVKSGKQVQYIPVQRCQFVVVYIYCDRVTVGTSSCICVGPIPLLIRIIAESESNASCYHLSQKRLIWSELGLLQCWRFSTDLYACTTPVIPSTLAFDKTRRSLSFECCVNLLKDGKHYLLQQLHIKKHLTGETMHFLILDSQLSIKNTQLVSQTF